MRAFVVVVPVDEVDLATDVLWGLGVRAIEERSGSSSGAPVELWTAVGEEPGALERAVNALAGRWPHRVVDVADEPAETWRDFSAPMWVDDGLVIVPAWQPAPPAVADSGVGTVTVVRIEPAGAFGLGDHPTTMLSLRAVRRLLDSTAGADVIDIGCGTGVIATTVALLGERSVRAIDLASAAVEATVDNARRNGVADRIVVDTTDLGDIDDDYDIVVANILAPTLVSLAGDLRRLTRPEGRLVISGILAGAHRHVLDALAPMEVERTDVLDGWACAVLRHPPHPTS